MQVEILISNDKLNAYSLTKPKIIIGSDSSCDIVLSERDVSRRHLLITVEEGKYYIFDQGSTNGSYLDKERMIPGKKYIFTENVPVRLASSTLVSLVDENEISENSPVERVLAIERSSENKAENTRIVSLKELKKIKTSHLVRKKNVLKTSTQKISASKKIPKFNLTHFLSFFILGTAAYITYLDKREKLQENKIGILKQLDESENAPLLAKNKVVGNISKESINEIMSYISRPKCTTEHEKMICENIKGIGLSKWGAIEGSNGGIYILLDGSYYYEEATKYLYSTSENKTSNFNEKDVWQVAVAIFINHAIESKIDLRENENHKLKFAFFLGQLESELHSLLEIDLRELQAVKSILNPHRLEFVPKEGTKPIKFALDYYQLSTIK